MQIGNLHTQRVDCDLKGPPSLPWSRETWTSSVPAAFVLNVEVLCFKWLTLHFPLLAFPVWKPVLQARKVL